MVVTFIEWVGVLEIVAKFFGRLLSEGRMGQSNDFNQFAQSAFEAAQDTILKGAFPPAIKKAAAQMTQIDNYRELVSELAGKIRGSRLLKNINPNDQGDVVQDALTSYFVGLKNMMFDKANGYKHVNDPEIDPAELANYIGNTFQTNLGWRSGDFYKRGKSKTAKTFWTTHSSLSDDESKGPEASYTDGDDDDPKQSSMKLSRATWNNAIHFMMAMQERLRDPKLVLYGPSGKQRISPKKILEYADDLNITIAIMRNLPSQMTPDMKEGESNQIYDSLKSMVRDPNSDISKHDRELLNRWVDHGETHRAFISTALWISTGMHGDMKPTKTVHEKYKWFYDIALDVEDHEFVDRGAKPDEPEESDEHEESDDFGAEDALDKEDEEDEPEEEEEDEPEEEEEDEPEEEEEEPEEDEPRPAPKPAGKPVQRGLFDNM